MVLQEIREAMKTGIPLIWNDPEPIEGNDYTISNIFNLDEEIDGDMEDDHILLIHYGGGSEAEVFPQEISLK